MLRPEGYLYDKEAVLTYIVNQKAEIARQLKQYEKDRLKEERELAELAAKEFNDKKARFVSQEMTVMNSSGSTSSTSATSTSTSSSSSISNMSSERGKQLPSFWIPDLTPSTAKGRLKKPSTVVTCPMSGSPLKANRLIAVTFTPVDPSVDVTKNPAGTAYKCALTHDTLTNSSKCVVLRTS